jgi:N6-L-threonylcarbamoyladenine synthase
LEYRRLGGTLDDAAGEAFDKVARLLGLSYPGGPSIEKAAKNGDPAAFKFPRAWLEESYDFSFSGLKTAVVREVLRLKDSQMQLPVAHLAASFQASVIEVLVQKTLAAAREFGAQEIIVAGGVSANVGLRETFLNQSEFPIHLPPFPLCTDNAAMIAGAGYYRLIKNHTDTMNMDVLPNWPLSEL